MRNVEGRVALPVLLEHFLDGRDDIATLDDGHGIAHRQLELVDILLVVEGGPPDGRASQGDGLQLRDRRDAAGAADLDGDAKDLGDGLRGLELVCDRPAGMVLRIAEGLPHVQLVDLRHHAVYLVLEAGAGSGDLLKIGGEVFIGQGPRLQPSLAKQLLGAPPRLAEERDVGIDPEAQVPEHAKDGEVVLRSLGLITPEAFVDEDREGDGGGLAALLPPHGAGGHVAWIRDVRIRLLQRLEVLLGKVDFPPHGKGDGTRKAQRHCLYRLDVLGDVVADVAVAAGERPDKQTLLVVEDHRNAVDLLLLHEGERCLGPLHRLVHPGDDLVGAVGLVEGEHGYRMCDFREICSQIAADPVRRAGRAPELRMAVLDGLELIEESVVLQVAHDGAAIHVVCLLGFQETGAERLHPFFQIHGPEYSPFQTIGGALMTPDPAGCSRRAWQERRGRADRAGCGCRRSRPSPLPGRSVCRPMESCGNST